MTVSALVGLVLCYSIALLLALIDRRALVVFAGSALALGLALHLALGVDPARATSPASVAALGGIVGLALRLFLGGHRDPSHWPRDGNPCPRCGGGVVRIESVDDVTTVRCATCNLPAERNRSSQ